MIMRYARRAGAILAACALAGSWGPPAAADDGALQITLVPIREVWYVGEPITVRVVFTNFSAEALLIDISPRTMMRMTFAVTYGEETATLVAPQRAPSSVKYLMLGGGEETTLDCRLVNGAMPFGADFDLQYYGALPARPAIMEIEAIYENRDAGVRNVVPFWTGRTVSEPISVQVVAR